MNERGEHRPGPMSWLAALGGVGLTRWVIRVLFAVQRWSKCLRLLEVRILRKALVRAYYRFGDYAPPPCMITVRMTNNCNLRCRQCAQWGEHGVFVQQSRPGPGREMSTADWKKFIRRMAPLSPHIYFFGGEPFLRKDLLELVHYAHERHVITMVNTNGHFLRERGCDVVRSGMDYIMVSLDGPQEVNNRIRLGKEDGYAAVAAGVEDLIQARHRLGSRYPLIELILTLTEENQGSLAETAAIARRWGVDYFAVTFGIFTTAELARESAEQLRQEFGVDPKFYYGFVRDMSRMDPAVIAAGVQEVRRLWGSRYKQYPPLKFDIAEFFHRPEAALTDKQCVAPWMTMQVMANGELAYCEDFADLVIGNVKERDPLVLWNSPASRAWRRRIRTRGILPAETRCTSYYLP
jgi:MoaA/NifB/PqqE/SkfB family radical SAM enzyme